MYPAINITKNEFVNYVGNNWTTSNDTVYMPKETGKGKKPICFRFVKHERKTGSALPLNIP
jgi:hypothetical protein